MSTIPTAKANESELALTTSNANQNLANYEKLVARVSDVFGSEIRASRWLSRPNPELNGESPIQVAIRDRYELRSLEPILTRMEHGIEL
jgi:uncharacterized protein (DUF2384 family)